MNIVNNKKYYSETGDFANSINIVLNADNEKKMIKMDPKAIALGVASNIKSIRIYKGLTGKRLGEMIGVSQQQVSRYERGDCGLTIDTLCKLAIALEVPLSNLLKNLLLE